MHWYINRTKRMHKMSTCLLRRLPKKQKPKRCSVCKHIIFANPHIQTKYYLEAIKFKTTCCDTVLGYNNNKGHIDSCPNALVCGDCSVKHFKEDEHKCLTVIQEDHQNNLARRNTAGIEGIDSGREIFVHGSIAIPGRCIVCREREFKYQCYICEKKICEKCSPVSAIFKIDKVKRYAKEQFVDYLSGYKCSTFFVIYSCYEEGLSECSFTMVITIYVLMGLVFDIFMAALIGMIYVVVIPILYFLFFTVFMMVYVIFYIPFTYFHWIICLNRKRICIKC
jgi:hypothetical protein